MKLYKVPTGTIAVIKGQKGPLECLCVGDYGKEHNIKADFLGYPNYPKSLEGRQILPFEEKLVITLSTQYGCAMKCNFCDAPRVGTGANVSLNDLDKQTMVALSLADIMRTKQINIHYARMGEPTFNPEVITHAKQVFRYLYQHIDVDDIRPVVHTMMPKHNTNLYNFIYDWVHLVKNFYYRGNAGFNISINTTNEKQRNEIFGGCSYSLDKISRLMSQIPAPYGRKFVLNFGLAEGYEVNAKKLAKLFDPTFFICKITPMHSTESCKSLGIKSAHNERAQAVEEDLKLHGFDVIVFNHSEDENLGRLTCGNAILSGSRPECKFQEFSLV